MWAKMTQLFDTDINEIQHHIRWIVEGEILMLEVQAEAPHLISFYDEMIISYLDAATSSIDIILKPPMNDMKPPSLKQLTTLKAPFHPRVGHLVMIREYTNSLTRFLLQIVSRVSGVRLRTFETIEEAVNGLRVIREGRSKAV